MYKHKEKLPVVVKTKNYNKEKINWKSKENIKNRK